MRKKLFTLSILFFAFLASVNAQINVRDSAVQGVIINPNLGFHQPGGDWADMYGGHMTLGMDVFYKTKSNWLIGPSFDYMFGSNVKNGLEVFGDFITEDGNLIGTGGDYVTPKILLRGWTAQFKIGKIIPIIGPNPNSGLLVQLGGGVVNHWTEINHFNSFFQMNAPYDKGYDQLHQGFLLSQYVAFFHASNRKTTNFSAGLYFQQGFTKNVREYNYFSRSFDTGNKLDLSFGIKASWFLPIYDKNAQKFYY